MLGESLFLKHLKSIKNSKVENYIFISTLAFYSLLWVFNPGNKIILASFIILNLIYYWRLKNLQISLILTCLASSVVLTGKRYLIELIPPGVFPKEVFPHGYILFFVITPKIILAFLISLIFIRDLIKGKFKDLVISRFDILVLVYFLWILISDIYGSIRPEVSILFTLSELSILVLYVAVRVYKYKKKELLTIIIALFAALTVFQSCVS